MAHEALIDETLGTELRALYREPGRHYHGIDHIEALLGLSKEYRTELADPEAVEAAIWLHDAIYDSRRSDNEARSAALAAERLAGRLTPRRLDNIVTMIEATASHVVPDLDGSAKRDAAFFLDMDLAILGASPAVFDAYEAAVRREYAWVEDNAWRSGRSAVLTRFLERREIFNTRVFRDRFEDQARQNIARSIASLTG